MSFVAKDKVIIITGGASGIGALVVREFLEEGAKHVTILDIANDAGISLKRELNGKYGDQKVEFIKCDVTDEDHLKNVMETVAKDTGAIDVVINNAAIMNDSPNCYRKSVLVNVLSVVTSSLKAIELMRKDRGGKGGTVINISSIAGLMQAHLLPVYFATKSAVLQFSNCIGMEPHYSRTGVRVITVCFTVTDTALIEKATNGGVDEETSNELAVILEKAYKQKPESAVRGVLEAFKQGESGSTWLAANDNPVSDITSSVKEAYGILTKTFTVPPPV